MWTLEIAVLDLDEDLLLQAARPLSGPVPFRLGLSPSLTLPLLSRDEDGGRYVGPSASGGRVDGFEVKLSFAWRASRPTSVSRQPFVFRT